MEERKVSDLGFLAGRWPLDPGKATLIFIHGAGGSARFWLRQVEGLTDRANTVALDLPGHGRSAKPGRERVPDYARRVVEFVDLLKPPRPVLAGLSMGGAITQQILLDHPGRFPIAILMSTGAKLKVLPATFDLLKNNFQGYLDVMAKIAVSPKSLPDQYQFAIDDTAAQSPEVITGDFRACDIFDARARLSEIKVPVLIISAQDDQLTPPAYGEFLEKNIAGARRVHLLDAGHLAPAEKTAEVNRAIIAFLDEHGY